VSSRMIDFKNRDIRSAGENQAIQIKQSQWR